MSHPTTRAYRRELARTYRPQRDALGTIIVVNDKYAPKDINRPLCPACHKEKMQFETYEKAMRFIEYNQDRILAVKGKAPVRAYYCKSCGCYHVTSKPLVKKNSYSA